MEGSEGIEVAEHTASRDLCALVGAGLLDAKGERRGRLYVAGPDLRAAWEQVRDLRPRGAGRSRFTLDQDPLPGI